MKKTNKVTKKMASQVSLPPTAVVVVVDDGGGSCTDRQRLSRWTSVFFHSKPHETVFLLFVQHWLLPQQPPPPLLLSSTLLPALHAHTPSQTRHSSNTHDHPPTKGVEATEMQTISCQVRLASKIPQRRSLGAPTPVPNARAPPTLSWSTVPGT